MQGSETRGIVGEGYLGTDSRVEGDNVPVVVTAYPAMVDDGEQSDDARIRIDWPNTDAAVYVDLTQADKDRLIAELQGAVSDAG